MTLEVFCFTCFFSFFFLTIIMLFPSFANNLRTFSSCYKKDDKFYKCLSVSFLCISHHLLLPSFSLLLLCCFETTSIESPDENSGLVSGCQLCPQAWRPKTWTNEGHYSLSCLISWQHKNMKKSLNSSLCMRLFSEKSCCDQDTIFTSPSMFCWSQLKVSYQFPSFFLPHETEPLHWFSQWFKTLLQDREKRGSWIHMDLFTTTINSVQNRDKEIDFGMNTKRKEKCKVVCVPLR